MRSFLYPPVVASQRGPQRRIQWILMDYTSDWNTTLCNISVNVYSELHINKSNCSTSLLVLYILFRLIPDRQGQGCDISIYSQFSPCMMDTGVYCHNTPCGLILTLQEFIKQVTLPSGGVLIPNPGHGWRKYQRILVYYVGQLLHRRCVVFEWKRN